MFVYRCSSDLSLLLSLFLIESLCVLVGTSCSEGTKYSCAQCGAEVAGATFLQLEPRLENWEQQRKGTLVNQVLFSFFLFVKTSWFTQSLFFWVATVKTRIWGYSKHSQPPTL